MPESYFFDLANIWHNLIWPLARMLCGMAFGLLLGNLLETLRWTEYLSKLASPLSRYAHLSDAAAASFAMAFVSPYTANGILAQNLANGTLSLKEATLANLFNSLPAFLMHTPAIFFIIWPVLGKSAFVYIALTLAAALLRLLVAMLLGHLLLPQAKSSQKKFGMAFQAVRPKISFRKAFSKAFQRFGKRLPSLIYYTVPVYVLIFCALQYGLFKIMENWLAYNLDWLSFIKPQAMGIIALQLLAEMGSALGAAGAVLETGSLSSHDVVVALLTGNVLATPIRAIRHQLPSYAGFFSPRQAVIIVLTNQLCRAMSLVVVIGLYAFSG